MSATSRACVYDALGGGGGGRNRTFEWVAEADEPTEKGLRAAVVLYCVRTDLIGKESLDDLAFSLRYSEGEVDDLIQGFCHAINWK